MYHDWQTDTDNKSFQLAVRRWYGTNNQGLLITDGNRAGIIGIETAMKGSCPKRKKMNDLLPRNPLKTAIFK